MKVLKTILRAFIFGIGVGVLLAPRAGSETRRLLSDKLNQVLEGAEDLTDKLGSVTDAKAASYVPPQHAVDPAAREVNSADTLSM